MTAQKRTLIKNGTVVTASDTFAADVWIEGDNWRKSLDSNDFGPISKGLIQGKAVKVWRDWFSLMDVGDERKRRESGMRSRVVKGRSEIPAVFLE